jgi:hypothetical protein
MTINMSFYILYDEFPDGLVINLQVTGLAAGTQYSFRICNATKREVQLMMAGLDADGRSVEVDPRTPVRLSLRRRLETQVIVTLR